MSRTEIAGFTGKWFFTAWHSPHTGRWVGLAKREPFVNGHPIHEPGDVWFEFGGTEDEALSSIRCSVGHAIAFALDDDTRRILQ